MPRLLIIGGSDAGISAALRARELDRSVAIQLVAADAYPNFSICGLPFYLSGETPDWRDLAHRKRPDIEAHGIELLLDHRAEHVDAAQRCVTLASTDGAERELPYDQLVIGTGAEPLVPPIEGSDLPGVHLLHTMDHSFAVQRAITEGGARSAVVVGAGYIGVEMADALTHRGLDVTLVEMAGSVLTTVDPELGSHVAQELAGHGVKVATGVQIERFRAREGGVQVVGSRGFERTADLVLVAVGVRPATALAQTAGATLGVRGAIRVDRGMRTGVEGVRCAGDCVETWHRLLERPTYLPLGTTAHKQGRVAGENAVGGNRRFAGSLGTQVVKVFDLAAARTGLREDEALDAGFEPFTVDATLDDHKAYYPGATPLRIRLTGNRSDGRLLGAQMVGSTRAQVAKRIDVYATALHHRMTVNDLSDLDLSYTPPFSSPWDPVQMAAQRWERAVRR